MAVTAVKGLSLSLIYTQRICLIHTHHKCQPLTDRFSERTPDPLLAPGSHKLRPGQDPQEEAVLEEYCTHEQDQNTRSKYHTSFSFMHRRSSQWIVGSPFRDFPTLVDWICDLDMESVLSLLNQVHLKGRDGRSRELPATTFILYSDGHLEKLDEDHNVRQKNYYIIVTSKKNGMVLRPGI